MSPEKRANTAGATVAVAALLVASGGYFLLQFGDSPKSLGAAMSDANAQGAPTRPGAAGGSPSIDLSESQLAAVKVEPVSEREFPIEKESVGSIDFNEDMTLQVFTPYPGRIVALFAKVGDDVRKGQTLFTIDSPDLLQAESTLIAAAGVLEFTTRNLARLRELYKTRAVSQKEMELATSDQQTAEGALRAARDSVRLFGKTDAEIDRIIAQRKADPILVVPSPITGRITARGQPSQRCVAHDPAIELGRRGLSLPDRRSSQLRTDQPAHRAGLGRHPSAVHRSRRRSGELLGRHNQAVRCRGRSPQARCLQRHAAPSHRCARQRQHQCGRT